MADSPLSLSRLARFNLAALCMAFLMFTLIKITEFLNDIMVLLAAALVLTYLLRGPVRSVENLLLRLQGRARRVGPQLCKTIAIITVYLMMLGLFAIASFRILPILSLQVRELAHDLPTYVSRLQRPGAEKNHTDRQLTELVKQSWQESHSAASEAVPNKPPGSETYPPAELLPDSTPAAITPMSHREIRQSRILNATLNLALQKLLDSYQQYASRLGGLLLDIGTTTMTVVVYTLTTLVLTFMLLHGGHALKDGLVDLMPSASENAVREFLNRFHRQFYNFLRGQVFISVISGGLMYLLLSLLDLKYALMLGIFYGLASILPVLGPWVGLLPITFLAAFAGHPLYIVHVLVFSGVFYLLKVYWLWPQLIHSRYDVHPIIFILSFVICLKVVGYPGMLLSFPLASAVGAWLGMIKARSVEANQGEGI